MSAPSPHGTGQQRPTADRLAGTYVSLGEEEDVATRSKVPTLAACNGTNLDRPSPDTLAGIYVYADDYVYTEGSSLKIFGQMRPVSGVAFSPAGRVIAAADHEGVQLWDVATGRQLSYLADHHASKRSLSSLTFSRDGRYLVVGRDGGMFRAFHLESAQTVFAISFGSEDNGLARAAFSSDSSRAILATAGGQVRVWDINKGEVTARGPGGGYLVAALAPDGMWALFGGASLMSLWDLQGDKELRRWEDVRFLSPADIVFSPDGRRALARDVEQLRLWDLETGAEVQRFAHAPEDVCGMAFSPDSRRVLTGSFSTNLMRLWDVTSGCQILCGSDHAGTVKSVAFSPDGCYALSGSDDGTIRFQLLPA